MAMQKTSEAAAAAEAEEEEGEEGDGKEEAESAQQDSARTGTCYASDTSMLCRAYYCKRGYFREENF